MMDQVSQMALETIRDLLVNVGFLSGVTGEVEEVQMELNTIHSFLKDADTRPDRYDSNTVRTWVAELRKLAMEAEDVLETYAIEVTSKREEENLKAKLRRFAGILSEGLSIHRVGEEIRVIRSRMAKLTAKLESIMAKGEGSSNSVDDQYLRLRQTYGHQVEEHFVGMEKDIECLMLLVLDVNRSNRVISIYGMGGLGKTTLAQKIYQNKEVQRSFEARVWVCVSQQFNVKSVLQQILKQLVQNERKEQITNMEQNELVIELDNVLRRKKCLIVIDDIWETDHWEILKPAFPIVDVNHCKILLTTRNERIASEEYRYKLDYLTEDQGWKLLQNIALPKDHSQGLKTDELRQRETIGREMVHKCGHLPLSISVIGGSLRHKQALSEWEKVNKNIDLYLKLGDGVGVNKRVTQVLDLSYNVLPYYLKPCFLYLGCFPEDQEINAEKLYLLWMAEGMISSEEKRSRETLRDVAERYLSELAFRCMVQVKAPKYSSAYNKFESCRLHDLMRDLCLSKGEEEGFLKVINFGQDTHYVPSIGTIPRLAIHLDHGVVDIDDSDERGKLKNLRSFLVLSEKTQAIELPFHYHSEYRVTRYELSLIYFKYLRTLVFEECRFKDRKLPSGVDKLIHLRYLSLYNCAVKELPSSVCNLPYLHTLNLVVWDSTLKLPNMICKMKRLRHLVLGGWYKSMDGKKLRLDGLNELETLEGFRCEDICAADIPKLTNLRKLDAFVKDNESISIIVNHISNNESLLRETILGISISDDSSLVEISPSLLRKLLMSHSLVKLEVRGRIGCNLPCYEPGLCTNLLDLSLARSEIKEDVMETLGKFPMLNSLNLDTASFIGTEMICRANAFPQLKSLSLQELSNLRKWRVDEGAMPNLSSLKITACRTLEMVPDGLRHITTLQQLDIYFMPKEFIDRLRMVNDEKGQDYDKICHIPSISFHGER
ncbi:hypothetical protein BUALT_Bualt12G0086100 [Buddleja alternifolia]|uniref:Disease resistance protein n=1 Tax=Buddleja alternifolia TaxID=168488 RepID=A0AAV6X042_9LAMI|nr:hypothetical protein BUALT_Bualt12G0086100 [Buddleja alternifolia]